MKSPKIFGFSLSALVLAGVFVSSARAQFTYPACANLEASHFKATKLLDVISDGLFEPVKIAFDQQNDGTVNFFWIELRQTPQVDVTPGRVRYYDAKADQVTLVGTLDVAGRGNDGLAGLSLDPGFKQNGWMYLQYSIGTVFRLSRFTVTNLSLDPASEAIICENTATRGKVHTGGAMQWDEYGDLWWSMGDNEANESGPSNTADLRGKLIRIRPLPVAEGTTDWGVGKTYTIPDGNFGEFMAAKYPNRSAEFLDKNKVKPEIYAMGLRNGYTLTIDPVRRWATWGDCGPDHGWVTEEDNFIVEPLNAGYPYFSGNNLLRPGWNENPDAPTNDANKGGIVTLPPAIPSIYPYQQACAMTGPIYRYDPKNPSPVKMPPHFNRIWFTTEFNNNWVEAFTMAADGKSYTRKDRITDGGGVFADIKSSISRPLDFQVGPDGVFYFVNYSGWYGITPNTSITKVEYIGPACSVGENFMVEKAGCMAADDVCFDPEATHSNPNACGQCTAARSRTEARSSLSIAVTGSVLTIPGTDIYSLQVTDVNGKTVLHSGTSSTRTHDLSGIAQQAGSGIYLISVIAGNQTTATRVFLF